MLLIFIQHLSIMYQNIVIKIKVLTIRKGLPPHDILINNIC